MLLTIVLNCVLILLDLMIALAMKDICFGNIIKPQEALTWVVRYQVFESCSTGNQICINTMGSYRCECPNGYEFFKMEYLVNVSILKYYVKILYIP